MPRPALTASRLVPPLVLGGTVLAFWWYRIVLPAKTLALTTTDLRIFFYPAYLALFGRLERGELPLWNPYQLCGVPALGSPQNGFFYPPHLLYLVLPSNVAAAVVAVAHLLLIAYSTAWFARRLGLGTAAAMLAAFTFALQGTIRAWLVVPPWLEAVAWLPLGGIAIVDLVRRPRARAVALLALAMAASWLAGGPQPTVYMLYAWSTLWLALLLGDRPPALRWLVAGALFAAGIALGTLTAGAQLAPAYEMAQQGTRALRQLDTNALFVLGGAHTSLETFLTEQTLGAGERFSLVALPLLAAVPFVRRQRALGWWCLLLGGAALVLACGPETPFFRIYFALPGLSWFRTPSQLLLLTDFTLAMAAAIALDALWVQTTVADGRTGRVVSRLAVVAAAVALCVARCRWDAVMPIILPAAVVVLVVGPWRTWSAAAGVAAVLVAIEAFVAPPNTSLLPYRGADAEAYASAAAVWEALRAQQGHDRVWIVRTGLTPSAFAPKLASVHRVRSLDDYETITLRRQAEYFTYLLERQAVPRSRRMTFAGSLSAGTATAPLDRLWPQRRLFDLTATRLVLVPSAMLALPALRQLVTGLGLRPLPPPRQDLSLFENPNALPRAYVVYRAKTAPAAPELLARLSGMFDPLAMSWVEGPPLPPDPAAPPRGQPATIVRDDEEVVEIDATLDVPGLVVLADSFYPGWRATVDDVPAEIVATNHLFRGVRAPAGSHRVRFVYKPASVLMGRGATFAALIVLVALLVVPAFGRGRRAVQPS